MIGATEAPTPAAVVANARAAQNAPPPQPDLIERYGLKKELEQGDAGSASASGSSSGSATGKQQAWSQSKSERQALLQRRRNEMILNARREMEKKVGGEKKG